jgi:hypothetical protein
MYIQRALIATIVADLGKTWSHVTPQTLDKHVTAAIEAARA